MKRHLSERASGDLGKAIAALAEQHGGLRGLAKRLGFSEWSVNRWVINASTPNAEAAEALVVLDETMRPLLEARDCFRERRWNVAATTKPARMTKSARQRIERQRVEAARRAADMSLPWPSEKVKEARMSRLRARVGVKRAEATRLSTQATKWTKSNMPSRPNQISRSGDFMEGLADMTTSDIAIGDSLMKELG